jgi:capsular exopolysaccharide synthesis family protein
VIGMIPALSRRTLGPSTPALLAVAKPRSAYAEALRSTHTTIMLENPSSSPRVVLVTSSLPDEGKSTFASSLAALMAHSSPDKRIILLDCDLRRSTVAKSLAVGEAGGTLDEFLAGAKTLAEVLRREPRSGLYYVAARGDTPNSGEILNSPRMRDLVNSLSKAFDLVVLDAPPLLAVADPRVLLAHADYVAFVVRWERTARDAVVNALKLLRDSGKHIGMILSQVDIERHARYGYGDMGSYYSKYRNYYTE